MDGWMSKRVSHPSGASVPKKSSYLFCTEQPHMLGYLSAARPRVWFHWKPKRPAWNSCSGNRGRTRGPSWGAATTIQTLTCLKRNDGELGGSVCLFVHSLGQLEWVLFRSAFNSTHFGLDRSKVKVRKKIPKLPKNLVKQLYNTKKNLLLT